MFAATGFAVADERPAAVFDRATFDRMDAAVNKNLDRTVKSGGDLAWSESYIMLSYTEMYRATKDRGYLDRLIEHADHVLKQRDDNRGLHDYSDRSRPAWSVGGKYTVATLTLKDDDGREVLRFRSTRFAFNHETTIQIKVRPDGHLFDLVLENPHWQAKEEYTGLNVDRTSPDCVERRVNLCDSVAKERKILCGEKGSSLVTVEIVGDAAKMPAKDAEGKELAGRAVAMVPLVMAFHGYSGLMTYPMLEFAKFVREDPALREKYDAKADTYVREAVRVFEDAEEDWRDGPKDGEGYYVNGEKGCAFWTDGVCKAFNYQCANGRALLRLGQLTRTTKWDNHAKAAARLFKRHLNVADNGSYVWKYSWGIFEKGWTRENSPSYNTPTWKGFPTIEDISHGHLDVDFARLCAENEIVFDKTDMQRFAATFLKNILDEQKWTTSNLVDGQGGYGEHNAVIGGWCDLARWEPKVADAIRKVCAEQRIDERTAGPALWTASRLVKWK